jgi:hypothetical protein
LTNCDLILHHSSITGKILLDINVVFFCLLNINNLSSLTIDIGHVGLWKDNYPVLLCFLINFSNTQQKNNNSLGKILLKSQIYWRRTKTRQEVVTWSICRLVITRNRKKERLNIISTLFEGIRMFGKNARERERTDGYHLKYFFVIHLERQKCDNIRFCFKF